MKTVSAISTRVKALAVTLLLANSAAWAQLSAPLADSGVPMGTGAGVHSPNSPFAPLQERADVLPWSVLTAVKSQS
jgi:hypothetical protein